MSNEIPPSKRPSPVRLLMAAMVFMVANNNPVGGDPVFGLGKRLNVQYTVAGESHIVSVAEGGTLKIPTGDEGDGLLVIVKATWGPA